MHDWKALVRARIEPLPLDPARASDIVDELAQHVAQHHADLVASGVNDGEAVAQVLAPLSHQEHVAAEIARADRPRISAPIPPAGRGNLLADLWHDLQYAARLLVRAPGFSAIAIVTLRARQRIKVALWPPMWRRSRSWSRNRSGRDGS